MGSFGGSLKGSPLELLEVADWKRKDMERELARYLDSASTAVGAPKMCSVAVDGSNVAGRSALACIMVLPNNSSVVLPPQERPMG